MKKSPYETERDAVADLAETVLKNDPDKAKPLLLLIDVLLRANQRGPVGESIVLDVKKFIYSKTEHSKEAMDRFIAEIIAEIETKGAQSHAQFVLTNQKERSTKPIRS